MSYLSYGSRSECLIPIFTRLSFGLIPRLPKIKTRHDPNTSTKTHHIGKLYLTWPKLEYELGDLPRTRIRPFPLLASEPRQAYSELTKYKLFRLPTTDLVFLSCMRAKEMQCIPMRGIEPRPPRFKAETAQ